jgi:hypothetical protein
VPSLVLVVFAISAFLPSSARASELLANAGFENGTASWVSLDAVLYPSESARSGDGALGIASPGFEQAFDVFQVQTVHPGWDYDLSAWVVANDPNIQRAFLRISWLDSGYGLISSADSAWLTSGSTSYRSLGTGPRAAPAGATMARVAVYVIAAGPFTALVDDASFTVASVSSSPPPSAPTAAPTVPPSPSITPGTSSPAPTPPPTPAVTAAPVGEPEVFDMLTNGGFEVVRADSTAYGWRNVGGVDRVIDSTSVQGRRSLEISSSTSSTKWAYQPVRIDPGAWYEASAWAKAGQAQAFLRLSWYASDDGSGRILESSDSTSLAVGEEFRQLVTGAVQAPTEARTVKVRLMLRPSPAGQGTVMFDDVRLTPSAPGVGERGNDSTAQGGDARGPDRTGGGAQVRSLTGADGEQADPQRIVGPLVNVPRNGVTPDSTPFRGSAESSVSVVLLVLVIASLLVIAAIMAREVVRTDRN